MNFNAKSELQGAKTAVAKDRQQFRRIQYNIVSRWLCTAAEYIDLNTSI